MRTVAAEPGVDDFELANEVDHVSAVIGAARGPTKVRSAAKGASLVNEAAPGFEVEHGAGPVGSFRQLFASSGPERLGGQNRFAPVEVRGESGELKLAAFL